jgi:phage recombination protein Bet
MNKITALVPQNENHSVKLHDFADHKMTVLKNTICKDLTNFELEIFLLVCSKTKLCPFSKQIYAIKRRQGDKETMTIQTSIDGFRLIADRTGCYVPGPESTFVYDNNGNLITATAYIKKKSRDGTWHTIAATAHMTEYCVMYGNKPANMWYKMPRAMLSKCAEALVLRKAFPAEISGMYSDDEMQQADIDVSKIQQQSSIDIEPIKEDIEPIKEDVEKITQEQAEELDMILGDCDEKFKKSVFKFNLKTYAISRIADLPASVYERLKKASIQNMEETRKLQNDQSLTGLQDESIIEIGGV